MTTAAVQPVQAASPPVQPASPPLHLVALRREHATAWLLGLQTLARLGLGLGLGLGSGLGAPGERTANPNPNPNPNFNQARHEAGGRTAGGGRRG